MLDILCKKVERNVYFLSFVHPICFSSAWEYGELHQHFGLVHPWALQMFWILSAAISDLNACSSWKYLTKDYRPDWEMKSIQGHLSWARLFWISWCDLLSARVGLTLVVSSCLCLCPARTLKWHGGALGWLWVLLTSGIGILQQFSLRRNPCAWLLGDIMHTRLPLVRLGHDNLWGTREPGSVRVSCLPWGRQGSVGAEGKCICPSPEVLHVFLATERVRWIILIPHTGVINLLNKTEHRSRVHPQSVYFHLSSKSTFLLPPLPL